VRENTLGFGLRKKKRWEERRRAAIEYIRCRVFSYFIVWNLLIACTLNSGWNNESNDHEIIYFLYRFDRKTKHLWVVFNCFVIETEHYVLTVLFYFAWNETVKRSNARSLTPLASVIQQGQHTLWKWDAKGFFTVASAYSFLIHPGEYLCLPTLLKIPKRVKIFAWLMRQNR
jgi:hypothetical protein